MRYTLFFPSSLFPLPSSLFILPCSLLPAPCSLLPKNQRFVPHGYKTCYMYLIKSQTAINAQNLTNKIRIIYVGIIIIILILNS
ncbi:hypothetical protein [Moorena producens]|uniref:hypothetical protein n=1 Tax=Moorena producens TaxID=1155739 RepID=UPI0011EA6610|nr:hypothetical protein [Moorena producens]